MAPQLSQMFAQLKRQAARTGTDRSVALAHGARMAVRVEANQITLTLARTPARLGDRELITFQDHCGVPRTALRWPATGQERRERDGVAWWIVAYRWLEEPAEPTEEP